MKITEYSPYSLVVRFESGEDRDKIGRDLIDLGGLYNSKLKGGDGYIFRMRDRDALEYYQKTGFPDPLYNPSLACADGAKDILYQNLDKTYTASQLDRLNMNEFIFRPAIPTPTPLILFLSFDRRLGFNTYLSEKYLYKVGVFEPELDEEVIYRDDNFVVTRSYS